MTNKILKMAASTGRFLRLFGTISRTKFLPEHPTNVMTRTVRLSALPPGRALTSRTFNSLAVKSTPMMLMTLNRRSYSHAPLTIDMVKDRVILVLRLYDKINPEKLTLESHFLNDLGLDSLDHVEVIMAMEDEFCFEIPESDAERLMRPADIVQYIIDKEELYAH